MNKDLEKLSEHLASQKIEFHNWDADSLLEFLFCCYTEDHPLDDIKIQRCYEKMEQDFESLPRDLSNQLFANIGEVCTQYELAAFIEGLHIGFALERELQVE